MNRKKTLLAIAVGVFLAGCGGGGGYQAPKTTSGFAVDGYLRDASVLCDANENGVYDAGETVVLSNKAANSKGEFVFPTGCTSTIVISGGTDSDTNAQFKGLLKAPAGSVYVTPLTSLMADTGLTAAQVAAALGLPFGTDVTKVDPNSNFGLQKRTLALQQIVQQVAAAIASLDSNASPEKVRAINSAVTKSIVATMLGSPNAPLIDAGGNVADALVIAIVIDSVAKVKVSNDPLLTSAKDTLNSYNGNGYSGDNIAELISGAVAAQAEVITKAGNQEILIAEVKTLQENPTIAAATLDLAVFLTNANNNLNLAAIGTSLTTLATTDTVSAAHQSAGKTLSEEVIVQADKAGIPVPDIDPDTLATITNYLYFLNDSIELNKAGYSLQEFANGIPQLATSFQSLSFSYGVNGTPIPVNAAGTMTAGVRIGIELTDTSGKGQVLQVILDKADVTLNGAGELSIDIPVNALMHVYGRTSSGVTANYDAISYTNADQLFVATTNGTTKNLTLDAGKIVRKIAASQTPLAVLPTLKGTFNLRMVISNLSLRNDPVNAISLVNQLAITANGSSQPPVNGLGIQGVVTLQ